MTEMERRVMEAIDANTQWCDQNFDLLAVARAAIRAMREPTEAMIDAGARFSHHHGVDQASHIAVCVWDAMTNAASPTP